MNFIAHYFLDRHRPESHFAVGAATPDLLSIYNSRLRIKQHHIKKLEQQELSEMESIFAEGVYRHFLADKVFHSSEFFQSETQHLSARLKEDLSHTEIHRKYFIAHVLLELLLDKVIIQDHPGILEDYYDHYGEIQLNDVRMATEKIATHPLPKYEEFLDKFRKNRFLFKYKAYDHIIYVLSRIMLRVGIENQAWIEDYSFVKLMGEYEDRLSGNYEGVFEEIIQYKE